MARDKLMHDPQPQLRSQTSMRSMSSVPSEPLAVMMLILLEPSASIASTSRDWLDAQESEAVF